MPSIRGIEKPHTSASTAATRCPAAASAIERFVVTDDLPTPPLPDAIASTRVRVSVNGFARGSGARGAAAASRTWSGFGVTPFRMSATARSSVSSMSRRSTSTRSTPGTAPAASTTRRRSSARVSSPGRGSARETVTRLPLRATSRTIPRSATERRSSGSSTRDKAARTSASTAAIHELLGREDFHYGDR